MMMRNMVVSRLCRMAAGVILVAGLPLAAMAGDVCDLQNGAVVFKKCAACHSMEAGKHMTGPSLHAVVGRQAGTIDGFRFSPRLKSLGVNWTPEILSEFLANPMKYAKGSRMAFSGLKDPAEVRDVICYLDTPAS